MTISNFIDERYILFLTLIDFYIIFTFQYDENQFTVNKMPSAPSIGKYLFVQKYSPVVALLCYNNDMIPVDF